MLNICLLLDEGAKRSREGSEAYRSAKTKKVKGGRFEGGI